MNCCLNFLRSARFTVLLHVMYGGHQSHLDSFWVLTGRLKLLNREQLLLSVVLFGHMRMCLLAMKRTHLPAFVRKWTWSRGAAV